jgi:hypothetical protein
MPDVVYFLGLTLDSLVKSRKSGFSSFRRKSESTLFSSSRLQTLLLVRGAQDVRRSPSKIGARPGVAFSKICRNRPLSFTTACY